MKTCIGCVHFYLTTATEDYSEYTPGNQFDMACAIGKWEFDAYDCTEQQFYQIITEAERCAHHRLKASFVL